MPAGYSGTPLVGKLGIKRGFRVRFVDAPAGYERTLGPLPEGVTVAGQTRGVFDLLHLFAERRTALDRHLPRLKSLKFVYRVKDR